MKVFILITCLPEPMHLNTLYFTDLLVPWSSLHEHVRNEFLFDFFFSLFIQIYLFDFNDFKVKLKSFFDSTVEVYLSSNHILKFVDYYS